MRQRPAARRTSLPSEVKLPPGQLRRRINTVMDFFDDTLIFSLLFGTKGGWSLVLSVVGIAGIAYGIIELVNKDKAGWLLAGGGAVFLLTGVVIAGTTIIDWWRDNERGDLL